MTDEPAPTLLEATNFKKCEHCDVGQGPGKGRGRPTISHAVVTGLRVLAKGCEKHAQAELERILPLWASGERFIKPKRVRPKRVSARAHAR